MSLAYQTTLVYKSVRSEFFHGKIQTRVLIIAVLYRVEQEREK